VYELWEQAGKPEGRDEEFYLQAERELQEALESARQRDTRRQQIKLFTWISTVCWDEELGCQCGAGMPCKCNDGDEPDLI
jgi:hypothetical protein